jgi:hypothetical protein
LGRATKVGGSPVAPEDVFVEEEMVEEGFVTPEEGEIPEAIEGTLADDRLVDFEADFDEAEEMAEAEETTEEF